MAHNEPPHQDLRCLQIQLFSSLVPEELNKVYLDGSEMEDSIILTLFVRSPFSILFNAMYICFTYITLNTLFQQLQLCTARTVWSDAVLGPPISVRSGK